MKSIGTLCIMILFLILGMGTKVMGQSAAMPSFELAKNVDSALISVYDVLTTEMRLTVQDTPYSHFLGKGLMSAVEINKIPELLKDPHSYRGKRAMLDHHDILIDFYQKGNVIQRIRISSYTGDIIIEENNCTQKNLFTDNHSGQWISDGHCFFADIMSDPFIAHLKELLKAHQLWESVSANLLFNH